MTACVSIVIISLEVQFRNQYGLFKNYVVIQNRALGNVKITTPHFTLIAWSGRIIDTHECFISFVAVKTAAIYSWLSEQLLDFRFIRPQRFDTLPTILDSLALGRNTK